MTKKTIKTYRCSKCRRNYNMTATEFIKTNSYVKSHKGVCADCARNIETKICKVGHEYKMPQWGECLFCDKIRKDEIKKLEEEKKTKNCKYCSNKYLLSECLSYGECPDCTQYKKRMSIISYGDTVELEYDTHTFDSIKKMPYSSERTTKVVSMPTHTGLTNRFLNIYNSLDYYDHDGDKYVNVTVYRLVSAKIIYK